MHETKQRPGVPRQHGEAGLRSTGSLPGGEDEVLLRAAGWTRLDSLYLAFSLC